MAWKKLLIMTIAVMAISTSMLLQNVAAQTSVPSLTGNTNILEDCGAEASGVLPAFTGADPLGLVPNEISNEESVSFTNNGNVAVLSLEVEAQRNWGGPGNVPPNVMDAETLRVDSTQGSGYGAKTPVEDASGGGSAIDLGGIGASGGTLDTYWLLQAILTLLGYSGLTNIPLDFIVTCDFAPPPT